MQWYVIDEHETMTLSPILRARDCSSCQRASELQLLIADFPSLGSRRLLSVDLFFLVERRKREKGTTIRPLTLISLVRLFLLALTSACIRQCCSDVSACVLVSLLLLLFRPLE